MMDTTGQGHRMQMPLLGDPFPRMEVQTTQGSVSLPGAYSGKWFLLFSHPADFTPVCTTEFVAFQKRYEKFKDLNTELIGLSVDQVFSHIKWIDWIKDNLNVEIKFPIITATKAIAAKLGLIHPGKRDEYGACGIHRRSQGDRARNHVVSTGVGTKHG